MCLLKLILVSLLTNLIGHLAWRTIRSLEETRLGLEDSNLENLLSKDKQELNIKRVCKKKSLFNFFDDCLVVFLKNIYGFIYFFSDDSRCVLGFCGHGEWEILMEELERNEYIYIYIYIYICI